MIQLRTKTCFCLLIIIVVIASCNNAGNTNKEKNTDTASSTTIVSPVPAYDPAMEPLTVGAKFSKLLKDSLGIKFYLFTINPGDSAALHQHPDHAVYVLDGGLASLSMNGSPLRDMELKDGLGFVSGPIADYGKNVGNTPIKMLIADVYRPRTGNDAATAAYDPALDPLTISGANGKLLHDTLGIKIFEGQIKPGEAAPLHKHIDHAMYVLAGGKILLYSKDFPGAEKGMPMEFKTGDGWVMGPVTDSARNIGNTTIKMLEIAVNRPRK